jgi:hypothetical protein
MFRSVCLVGAVLALAIPSLAETTCGSAPLAPAVPAIGDLNGKTPDDAHTVVLGALKSVKTYQVALGSYRECLKVQTSNQKIAVAAVQDDKAKAAVAQQKMDELQTTYDKTVDTEVQVVTDYSNLHNGYCKMGEGLVGCAKPK